MYWYIPEISHIVQSKQHFGSIKYWYVFENGVQVGRAGDQIRVINVWVCLICQVNNATARWRRTNNTYVTGHYVSAASAHQHPAEGW